MLGALSSASPLIFRCVLRWPPPSTTTTHFPFIKLFNHASSSISPPLNLPISHALSSLTLRCLSTTSEQDTQNSEEVGIDEIVTEIDAKLWNAHKEMLSKLKGMSVKEKKELGSYANSLGKKLKSQQVGKSGVTDSVATALLETLEANELLKLKIHNNCPGELEDVVNQLEQATGSVVVGRIGRTVIIYRPSLTKLKAEEKKKQALKVFLKRKAAFKSSYQGQKLSSKGQSNRSPYFRKS